jgi:GntR family transcriptional regulator
MKTLFAVDAADPTPIYAQLERSIRSAIATGQLRPGDQLPTVRQLAVDLVVNANTVARVYAELERAGVLETRRGVGTFIGAGDPAAVRHGDRNSRLRALVDRLLAEAAALGFPAREVLDHLSARLTAREDSEHGRHQ